MLIVFINGQVNACLLRYTLALDKTVRLEVISETSTLIKSAKVDNTPVGCLKLHAVHGTQTPASLQATHVVFFQDLPTSRWRPSSLHARQRRLHGLQLTTTANT